MVNLFVKIASFAGNLFPGKCSLDCPSAESTCYNPAGSPRIYAAMHLIETPFPGNRTYAHFSDFFTFRAPTALHVFPAILLRFSHIVQILK
jgi:hypothetical protein